MAKRPTRLRFTEDDLADSHVKKAADRADKAVDRAEKAADKLASKKAKPKLKLETDAAGSRKAKLRFEKAEFTEIERPSVAKHMASRGAAVTLTSKAHRAVSEYEDDNIGVQAVQETTKAVESTVYTVDHAVYSHKLKAYDKAEKLVEKSDIPKSSAKPGDLIFFQGTYDTSGASHVGIYVGNGMMIHCGNPISYASIESNYWQQHFYCFGRIRN